MPLNLSFLPFLNRVEKAAIKAQEAKRQELSKQKASLIRAEAKVEDLLQLQAEVQSEQDKLSGVRGTAKGIAEEQMRDEVERSEQLHQIKASLSQVSHTPSFPICHAPLFLPHSSYASPDSISFAGPLAALPARQRTDGEAA